MNENKHKSCRSRSENILIEQSFNSSVTPKPTCNFRFLFCSWLLFRCTIHNNETPRQLQRPFVTLILQKPRLAEKIFNGKSRKLEVWQFISVPTLPKQRCNSGRLSVLDRSTIFLLPVLQLSCSSLICGKSQWLETVIRLLSLNTTVVFCKTRFSSHHSVCLLIYSYS